MSPPGVDGDCVRRVESAYLISEGLVAQPCVHLAIPGEDADSRPQAHAGRVCRKPPEELTHIGHQLAIAIVDIHAGRSGEIEPPLRLESAVRIEHLNPLVLPVGNIYPAISIRGYVVRYAELAFVCPRLAPGEQIPSVWRVLVYPGITVAVRYVQVPVPQVTAT